jgi:hypothetical protein
VACFLVDCLGSIHKESSALEVASFKIQALVKSDLKPKERKEDWLDFVNNMFMLVISQG